MRLSATTLRGNKVSNYDNEDLGTVEDFMLDTATGTLGYAVLSFAAVVGTEKLFAVPIRALSVDSDGRRLMLNADKNTVRNAPGFDRHSWPNTADPRWRSGIMSYYSF
jgi:sporulation protein YlmC with PRC-barrel domain